MTEYFLWQHEYRKRWIMYPESEINFINAAVFNKESTVVLPNKTAGKEVLLDFNAMIQRNKKTLYEQRIRCIVFSSEFFVWLSKDDKNEWCSCKPNLAALFEIAHLKGDKVLTFYDDGDYEINLESLKIKNNDTGLVFPVKREEVDISTSIEVKMIQELSSTKLSSLQSTKPSKKRKLSDVNTVIPSDPPSVTTSARDDLDVDERDASSSSVPKIVPVDAECPEKDNFHIYCKEGTFFSATLNQANVIKNNNKFYIIQLLKHNDRNEFAVWRRWGRVGNRGQTDMTKYGSNFENANSSFESKFYDKTKNRWSEVESFKHVSSKYDLVDIDSNPEPEVQPNEPKSTNGTKVVSKLDANLQALLEIICDKQQMEDLMKDMSYDSNKTPLGKLTAKQVKDGYSALTKISEILKSIGRVNRKFIVANNSLIEACNDFYTKIPHNFGRKTPPLIETQAEIDRKIYMLEALSNISVAMGVLNTPSKSIEHPLDSCYYSLHCTLELLSFGCPEYLELEQSLKGTHGKTHSSYEMEIVDAFKCRKEREDEVFKDSDNKLLLWHGSRITNWIGILKEGLRIAPPEAPITGYMFGKGVYFADASSKSANYCFATKRNNEGLLLLCEVSLGKQHSLLQADEYLPATLPPGYNSVIGNGRIIPSEFKSGVLSSDAKAPFGPLIEKTDHDGALIYNEYIVYDVRQVKMRYLTRVRFNFK